VGAPTGADLLADLTAHLVRASTTGGAKTGTYHAAAAGETTWHGYARHVIEFGRVAGVNIKVPASNVEPVATTAYPTPARRPANSRLDTRRLRETFNFNLPDWRVGVDRMLTEVLGR
jgi:dTDP-4-dehydrorhamnose reductase